MAVRESLLLTQVLDLDSIECPNHYLDLGDDRTVEAMRQDIIALGRQPIALVVENIGGIAAESAGGYGWMLARNEQMVNLYFACLEAAKAKHIPDRVTCIVCETEEEVAIVSQYFH